MVPTAEMMVPGNENAGTGNQEKDENLKAAQQDDVLARKDGKSPIKKSEAK